MSGLSLDSPTNGGYYAESSQARALTIGDLGHPTAHIYFLHIIPFRRLHRSMAEQKLDLFEFASTSMADARAAATKIVRCQIAYAGLLGATFDRIPDYVGCHPSILSRSILQNPSEHFPLVHARMAEPDIYKSLAPIRHRHR